MTRAFKHISVALVIIALLAGSLFPAASQFNSLLKDVPKLTGISEILLLQSLDDGSVIFSKNENRRCAPASLTKIVTAILVLEKCGDLSEAVTAPDHCIEYFYGLDSSNAGIRIGERLTVEQLLYCMLLPSANEAALILADHFAESWMAFVEEMNAFAQGLGCRDTHFSNPHGLDDEERGLGDRGHYTTAADMALITGYALRREFKGNALFEKIVNTRAYEVPPTNMRGGRSLVSTNKMLNRYYPDYYSPDISGVKTGNTDLAGNCIVAKASRAGFHYLCIVMRGQEVQKPGDDYKINTAMVDAKAMLDWAFEHIQYCRVADPDKAVTEIPVDMARSADHVQLVPAEAISAFVPVGVDSGSVLIEPIPDTMPEKLIAPVDKGRDYGIEASIKYAGEEFARVKLVPANDISRSATMYLVFLAKQAARMLITRILLALVLLVGLIYLLTLYLQKRRKRRERQLRVLPNIDIKY